jgi:hypothetical protein
MQPAVAESKVPTEPRLLALDAATDAGACGHKAATLAQLRNLGFDVPDGFVIPAGVQVSREEICPTRRSPASTTRCSTCVAPRP